MFEQILQPWKASLLIFSPNSIKSGLVSLYRNYVSAMKNLISSMRWFFVADLFLMTILFEAISKKITSGEGFDFFVKITDLNWFIIYSATVILMCKSEALIDAKTFLKSMFFKYIRGLLILMMLQILFLILVVMFGITHLPSLHWTLKIVIHVFEWLTIFYWLNAGPRFTDFIISIEKTANLIFYNLPVVLIFLGVSFGLNYWLRFLSCIGNNTAQSMLLDGNLLQLLQSTSLRFTEVKLIFIKYSKLMLEFLWLSILFLFYDKNRDVIYSKSIFEYEENESD